MDFKKYLTDNVLPFWIDNAIDDKYGGIYTQLDRKGNVYGTDKSVWFQGRALWTFSKAYNYINKDERYLKAAKRIYDFLPLCSDIIEWRTRFLVKKSINYSPKSCGVCV